MKQQFLSDAIATEPTSAGATSVGNPTDGDPANNVEATAPGAYWFHQVGKELEAAIEAGGLTPDPDTLNQLAAAIQAIATAAAGLDTTAGDARYLRRTQNLGDLNNAGTARNNLGITALLACWPLWRAPP